MQMFWAMVVMGALVVSCGNKKDDEDAKGTLTVKAGAKGAALLGGDPSSVRIKVTGAWISTTSTCDDLKVIYDGSNADYRDFILNPPSVFSSELDPGTYNCVVLRMSDWIKFTPATNQGTMCIAGTEATQDVCAASPTGGNEWANVESPAGTTTPCGVGDIDEQVYVWISSGTAPTGQTIGFQRPDTAGAAKGIYLAQPLVIEEGKAVTAYFNMNGTGLVGDQSRDGTTKYCGFDQPTFSFVQ